MLLDSVLDGNIKTSAMLDCGATSQFMDYKFAKKHSFKFHKIVPELLSLADGRPAEAGPITHEVRVQLRIDQHLEHLVFRLTKLGNYDLILGKSWLRRHNPVVDWEQDTVEFRSRQCQKNCLPLEPEAQPTKSSAPVRKPEHHIAMVSAVGFARAVRTKGAQLFAVSIEYIEKAIRKKEQETDDNPVQLRTIIPPEYHDFLELFLKQEADKLPPHRYVDHAIEIEEGKKPPFGPLYSMSEAELRALKQYLEENLSKGFIRASKSSAASPVLFAKKSDGSLRFCVDYRALNEITRKNRYPLPLIDETLNRLRKAKYYTRLDLRWAFNLIRIRDGDEWLTAFRTRYGLFEYLVMPFGLTNAPATCQTFVNDTLREFLDIFCVAYLDDILIYSEDLDTHTRHVRMVLSKLQKAGLFLKPEKCEFHTTSTTFLGFIISRDGISMDPKKVVAVKEWEEPQNVKDLQCFLGFANFYRRFIRNYSKICYPLFSLLRKEHQWNWTQSCQKAFELLRDSFCAAPILKHFDPNLSTILETDASDYVIAGILSQQHSDNNTSILHPVAYFSRKMTPAECNYGIGDKELLAIVTAFTEWHQYLEGLPNPVDIYTDHSNLQTFMTKMRLSRRQVRWAQKLSEYNFRIIFREGRKNQKADALTRRSGDLPGEEDGRARPSEAILKPENFALLAVVQPLQDDIIKALSNDQLAKEIIKALETDRRHHPRVPLGECKVHKNGLLTVNGLIYIPNDEQLQCKIIKHCHEHPAAGHPGRAATYEIITREFWWPSMRKTIARFISNCDTCARSKPVRHPPFGYLSPLPVPQRRWQSVSMDFIVGLPISDGNDSILVVVDRLSKMAHFIPCTSEITSEGTAKLFADFVFKLHGIPANIVSDRGPQFISVFTRALCKILGITQNISTSFHPQTDGQTERINAILEQYLRAYVNYQQDNWAELLTMAEFSYNNTVSSTTGLSPFFANYGQHPKYEMKVLEDSQPDPEIVKDFREKYDALNQHLRDEMKFAQATQSDFADKRRMAPPDFRPGDKVWLLRRHLKTSRPSNKLDYKRLGKFTILAKISPHAYKLELPPTMKVHPVFHVSLLEPAASNPLEDQVPPNPPPIIIEGEEEYEVEEILDSRFRYRHLQYLVKWTGDYLPTWEPHENLSNSPDLVLSFHQRYPDKPRPRALPNPQQ